jgi:hypothetical protein
MSKISYNFKNGNKVPRYFNPVIFLVATVAFIMGALIFAFAAVSFLALSPFSWMIQMYTKRSK